MKLITVLCLMLACTAFSLAADFSSLPPDAQKAISAAINRDVAERNPAAIISSTLSAGGGANGDYFGNSVAIDGNTVVVGAPFGDSNVGAAYVFVKPGSGWQNMQQTATLTPSSGAEGNGFGFSVAVSGNTIIVGSPTAPVGGNTSEGVAYVFVKPTRGWHDMTETAELTASDGTTGDEFGTSVAISGSTAVVGARSGFGENPGPGRAYVFVAPASGWNTTTQTAELTPSDGTNGDDFGTSVSISGNTVLVGAIQDSCCYSGTGSAYIFVEPADGWANMTETAELTASDGMIGDLFGWSVSLDTSVAVIAAPSNEFSGAAYVFVKPPGGWENGNETAKLGPLPATAEFASSVSISRNVIAIGAPHTHLGGAEDGAAYVFLEPKGGWKSTTRYSLRLSGTFAYSYDYFGSSVAVSGKTGVISAPSAPTSPPCKPVCQLGPGQAFVFAQQ